MIRKKLGFRKGSDPNTKPANNQKPKAAKKVVFPIPVNQPEPEPEKEETPD